MEHICKCNNCDNLYLDTNPQTNAKKFDVDSLGLDELIDHKCPKCKTDGYLTDEVYKDLWEILGNTFINDDGELLESFLHFEIGTDREEIWHWFEETFDISVAVDLMNLK